MRTPAISIRLKLLFLVALASLPALVLALYFAMEAQRQALDKAKTDGRNISRDIAMRQEQLTASTRQFLSTLSRLSSVRERNSKACIPLFRELLAANPVYGDIILSSPQGDILASARLKTPPINLSTAPYFSDVLKTKDFVVGGYRKSRTTGLDVLVCAHPVFGPGHELVAVVSTGVRLSIYNDIMQGITLPAGSTLFLADRNGLRLFNRHFPDPRPDMYPVGKPITLSLRERLDTLHARGAFFANGHDGTRRLYVVQESRLHPTDSPYLYVAVSQPESAIRLAARQSLSSNLSVLALAALLTGLGTWLVGDRLFVRRIERLAQVAERFAAGDLGARTNLPGPLLGSNSDELGQLGHAIDRIGEELSAREVERESTLMRLARTQFAVDNAGDEIFWADEQGRLRYGNLRAAQSLGYTQEELQSLSIFDVDTQFNAARWEALLEQLETEGPTSLESRQRTRTGEEVPKKLRMSLVKTGQTRLVFAAAHDVREKRRQEAVLRSLLDETAAVTGQAFFSAFTSQLISVLNVHAAFIGEYLNGTPTRVRTLSLSCDGRSMPNIDFPLADSPGKDIPDNGFFLVPGEVHKRYPEADRLLFAEAESYLGVPMHNAEGKRIGHLSIMSRQPLTNDPGLISVLRLFAQRAAAELTRMHAERELRASLHEKEVLLKEIHHRVKNNMQIVSSLLSLQARDVHDPAVLELLEEGRARVLSMALVHEDLYQSGNLARVDFRHYMQRLTERIHSSMGRSSGVDIELDLDELPLGIDQAIPLGLLCNELVTNAFKHAFTGRRAGVVLVSLHHQQGQAVVCVRDNGNGLPPGFAPGAGNTLGLELVWSLAEQLGGQAEAQNDHGAVFTVRFPVA